MLTALGLRLGRSGQSTRVPTVVELPLSRSSNPLACPAEGHLANLRSRMMLLHRTLQ